jgi:hypothetical protein
MACKFVVYIILLQLQHCVIDDASGNLDSCKDPQQVLGCAEDMTFGSDRE